MRVVAGTLGGRRLAAPKGLDTRPTSDRVRESLFMTLEPLTGVRVVDLFAGSGALGIEALSRGAEHADFVEISEVVRRVLSANLASLGIAERARVWGLRLPAGLGRLREALAGADLVLLDPPYGGGPARSTLAALGESDALRAGARVVVEHHAKDELPVTTGRLRLADRRRYGETCISRYDVGERPADV